MSAFTPSIPLFLTNRTPCPSTTPCMSAQRPRRSNRRPQKRQPSPQSQSDSLQFFSDDQESEQLTDVDDGFFSRYMRDREQGPEDPLPRQRMDRETAASAFDAVDKLFGSLKAEEKGQERRKWLDDVQARAATTEENSRKDDVLDVDAEDVDRDEFSEARIEDDQDDNDEVGGGRKSGFKHQKGKVFDEKYSFDMLMKIARKGPSDNRKRADPRKNDRDSRQKRVNTVSEKRKPSDFSHLLGLTKRIIDRKDGNAVDDYEPIDDEMDKTIEFRGAKRKDLKRRQKFTGVRRIGGQSRRIFTKPNEWLPLTEGDVEGLKSDYRSFGNKGRDGKLKGVVAECHECRGAGLDTCVACLGAGWVQPLSDKVKMDDARREILEEMWSRPNLVVDSAGEAQCTRCNGVGKQFCKKCQGSGSALRKGFSFSERDEVFGMFVNVEGGDFGEDKDDEYDDDDDEEEEDESESFQLYQGSGETFDFMRKKREEGEGKDSEGDDDQVDGDDVIEVEDESSELLAALEAMHLADIEERKTGKRPARRDVRIRGIDEDDEDDEDVDDVDDVDNVDDVDVDEEDDEDSDDDDFAVDMGHSDTEDLADLDDDVDDDDEEYGDMDEEDIEVDMRFSEEDDEDDDSDDVDVDDVDDVDDDDVNEENFDGYD